MKLGYDLDDLFKKHNIRIENTERVYLLPLSAKCLDQKNTTPRGIMVDDLFVVKEKRWSSLFKELILKLQKERSLPLTEFYQYKNRNDDTKVFHKRKSAIYSDLICQNLFINSSLSSAQYFSIIKDMVKKYGFSFKNCYLLVHLASCNEPIEIQSAVKKATRRSFCKYLMAKWKKSEEVASEITRILDKLDLVLTEISSKNVSFLLADKASTVSNYKVKLLAYLDECVTWSEKELMSARRCLDLYTEFFTDITNYMDPDKQRTDLVDEDKSLFRVEHLITVTKRVSQIKQPDGGYLKPAYMHLRQLTDDFALFTEENIASSIVGIVVDYLSRYMLGEDIQTSFRISFLGAKKAERHNKGSIERATKYSQKITGLDYDSIVNACKLAFFDVWYRNYQGALFGDATVSSAIPNKNTANNIRVMVQRTISFFKNVGPVIKTGFTFEPPNPDRSKFDEVVRNKAGSWGGYSYVVSDGDGDFLTKDTLWDLKVSLNKPTSQQTLQLLMYWVMGKHSGQDIYNSITTIGIYNPRQNVVYSFDINNLPSDIIDEIEKYVLCY